MAHDSRVITVHIARPLSEVAAYLADPAHMNDWAAGLGHSLRQDADGWHAEGAAGPVRIRFAPKNDLGVFDHWVETPSGEVYVPLRAVAHGHGTDVQLTLFRTPGMDDAHMDADAAHMRTDLDTLARRLTG